MRHSIIGAGKVGIALVGQFARATLPVAIANTRGPETIAVRVAALDGVRAAHLDEALRAEVIILALPFVAVETLAALMVCQAMSIAITVVLPLPVAIFRAMRNSSGFDCSLAPRRCWRNLS